MTAPGADGDWMLVVELVGLLNDAEHYDRASLDERLAYLDRRAKLLHHVVDARGTKATAPRPHAEDRADKVRAAAESLADARIP